MRTTLSIILLAFLPILAARPLSVIVSIAPQLEAVRTIAGDNAAVGVLVPKGASPETYSPSAAEIRRLSDADVLFTIGVPIEKAILPKLRQVSPRLRIVDTTKGMALRDMEGGHSHHSHGSKDPHVWLSIDNMIAHAKNISLAIAELDSANADVYATRANDYITSLKTLKADLDDAMKPLSGSRLLVFHPAFGYFLDPHGIEQIPVEVDGHEPSGRHLAELSKTVGELKAKVIFVQPQSNKTLVSSIPQMLSLKQIVLDPLPDDYSNGMRAIAKSIMDSLNK